MSKRKYGLTEEKIKEKLKDGFGQGKGVNYKPWIETYDFPSDGNSSKCFSWKTKRLYHFMSGYERKYFYLLQWSDKVVDIREQFPLIKREDAIRIAENKGIRYPVDPKTRVPIILTTDFMVTINTDSKLVNLARTVKPSGYLERSRVIEKFEIERWYWEEQGIDWGIVTEYEIPKATALNIEWAYSAYNLERNTEIDVDSLKEYANTLKKRLKNSNEKIQNILNRLDEEFNVDDGTFLYLFKHLIATKQISLFNMNEKISLRKNVDVLIKEIF